ncbi:polysaccharide biosynthesis protein [Natronococcus jeotgali DSM 18795]|uniref:Polysaccharide biosynthesis protein n=1 Tax=Natronococcus jeotgali DSM 18795 TaxID=1227498 RepID=L9XTD9_9EURY|nr:polysaccharide biosynthesis protein [Natronococcus jeotgali DSM 18795]
MFLALSDVSASIVPARGLLELPVSLVVVPPFGAVVSLVLSVLFGAVDTDEITDLLETSPDPIADLGSSLR